MVFEPEVLIVKKFSKASKTRDTAVFEKLLNQAIKSPRKKKGNSKNKIYFPLDSTFLQLEVRVVDFCSLENRSEYRLATNLNPEEFSYEEIGEIYRCLWGIETLWKFLKMHLKLDRLMTKNEN